jgi:hypothetical protein
MIEEIVNNVEKATGYRMENEEKATRAIDGASTSQGLVGGVGRDAEPKVILAKYDQFGGYITIRGIKAKNGQFYDKQTKTPTLPEKALLLIRVNGELIEQVDGGEESLEVKIALKQKAEQQKRKASKKK